MAQARDPHPPVPAYASPWELLIALSHRLRCNVESVPAPRAMSELLTYFEELRARNQPIPHEFLRTAALLLAKLSELPFHESYERIDELAAHLKRLNEKRPQAARWTEQDWRRLARLVFENRHLSTAVYLLPTRRSPGTENASSHCPSVHATSASLLLSVKRVSPRHLRIRSLRKPRN
jgi:hypothetical protein